MNAIEAARLATEKTKQREAEKQAKLRAFRQRTSKRVNENLKTTKIYQDEESVYSTGSGISKEEDIAVPRTAEALSAILLDRIYNAAESDVRKQDMKRHNKKNRSDSSVSNSNMMDNSMMDDGDNDDVDSCLSDDGVKSNHSDGLELPEGSELARLVTKEQEEYCAGWGYLQTFCKNKDDYDIDVEETDGMSDEKDRGAEDRGASSGSVTL